METTATAEALIKPRLRGVSHQISFFVAAAAGVWLLTQAKGQLFWGSVVYLIALCGQFAVSALYHRPTWGPKARQWWRRVDHAFIMILIAGTVTPIALALPPESSRPFLTILWAGATLGVLRALVWITAPKPVAAILALGLAWLSAPFLPALNATLGTTTVLWIVGGGLLYSLGAVAYATKHPNPWPRVFGYHEVFHAFVVLAAAAHFVAVSRVVLGLH
ncbi:MAG: PAQR family membrane homeostasis protein TrhA [Myxococcota bacterium]